MNATTKTNDRPLYAFYRNHGAYALEVTTMAGLWRLDESNALGAWIAAGGRMKDCAMFRSADQARRYLETIKGDLFPAKFQEMSAKLD